MHYMKEMTNFSYVRIHRPTAKIYYLHILEGLQLEYNKNTLIIEQ